MHLVQPSKQGVVVSSALVFILGAAVLYHITRIRENREYLTRRNFRVLAIVGHQLQHAVYTTANLLKIDVAEARAESMGDATANTEPINSQLESFQKKLGKLVKMNNEAMAAGDFRNLDVWEDCPPATEPPNQFPPRECLVAKLDASGRARIDYKDGRGIKAKAWLQADLDLAAIIKPFLVRDVFESVLLLDQHGRTILALQTDLEVQQISIAAKVDDEKQGALKTPPVPLRAEMTGPKVVPVELGSGKYWAFHQPVDIDLPNGQIRAAVCGLVRQDEFRSEELALHPYVLVSLTLVFLIGVLAWPFLRIALVGAREGLGVRDLIWVTLSLVTITALATVLVLDATSYLSGPGTTPRAEVAYDLDAQLQQLASDIRQRFVAEANVAIRELYRLEPDLADEFQKLKRKNIKPPVGTRVPPKVDNFSYENVGFIEKSGWQRVKLFAAESPAPFFKVLDREYFRRIVEHRGWRFEPTPTGLPKDIRFFIDPVWSRSTGELVAVVSASPSKKPLKDGVITLGVKLLSVIRPILPVGFDFALLADDGRTLFHSELEHTVEENFFEETQKNRPLLAAVEGRSPRTMNVRYWGHDRRLRVEPLGDFPLTVAVLFDKDLLRTVHLETLSLCVMLFTLLLIIAAFYGWSLRLFIGSGSELWIWPDKRVCRLYLWLIPTLLLIGLANGAAAAGRPYVDARLIVCLALPLVALGLIATAVSNALCPTKGWRRIATHLLFLVPVTICLGCVSAMKADGIAVASLLAAIALSLLSVALSLLSASAWRTPLEHRGSSIRSPDVLRHLYTAFALSALFAAGGGPAYSFFRLALDRKSDTLVREGQLGLARHLDRREAALESSHPGKAHVPLISDSDGEKEVRHLYSRAFFDTRIERAPYAKKEKPEHDLLTWMAAYLPLFNRFSVRLQALSDENALDVAWKPEADQRLKMTANRNSGEGAYQVSSAAPSSAWLIAHKGVWTGFALTLLLVGWLTRIVMRRLFLVGFKDPETIDMQTLADLIPAGHMFIVCAPLGEKAPLLRLRQQNRLSVIDLGREEAQASDLQGMDFSKPRAVTTCFDRFELVLNDPAQRFALLDALETALEGDIQGGPTQAPVVILSEVEPEVAFSLEGLSTLRPGSPDEEVRRRWARLLGRFTRVLAVDLGEKNAFKAALDAQKEKLRERLTAELGGAAETKGLEGEENRELIRGQLQRLDKLTETLQRECEHHRQLQNIGRQVVRLPDFADHDPERLVRRIRELADSYYRALWTCLSDAERLLLFQVAKGGLVNPRAGRAHSRLLAHRLLVRKVGFAVMNQSFGRFIVSVVRPHEESAWKHSGAPSTWAVLRLPMGIVGLGVLGYVLYNQRDALPTALTALAGVLATLPKVLDALRPNPAKVSAGN